MALSSWLGLQVCVFITAVPITKLCANSDRDGVVLRADRVSSCPEERA